MLLNNHVTAFYNLLVVQVAYVGVAVNTLAERFSELGDHNRFDSVEACFMPVVKEQRRFAVLHHLVNIR